MTDPPGSSAEGPVQRLGLVDQVARALRQQIRLGQLPVGARLPPEPALMRQLGVGRSTVREAVRVLAHSGLLEVRQGDGTYVRATPAEVESLAERLREARVADLHEARQVLEVQTARLAARRRSEADLATLAAALERRADAVVRNEVSETLDADLALHRAVARASGNSVLADLYDELARRLRPSLDAVAAVAGISADRHQLHAELIAAIARQDEAAAERLANELLEAAGASVDLA